MFVTRGARRDVSRRSPEAAEVLVRLRSATLAFADRPVWTGVDLDIAPGEFMAVLGPNGAGKTTLLNVLLGLLPLTAGTVEVCGAPPRRGAANIGYIPQQKAFDRDMPLRGRDLVALGLDGHRYTAAWRGRASAARVDDAIEAVGAAGYANAPIGTLSGGEQQRLRIAQALVGDPQLLLCDEPLLSLDLHHQHAVSALIDARRRSAGTAVVFVTHEINPILPLVDRVLYFVGGRWAIGTPDEVITSASLSSLYEVPVDVVRIGGRVVIVGAPDVAHHGHH